MAEPRPDMLPDESLTTPEVEPTPQKPVEPVVEPVQPEVPGSKTPESKLFAALQEERAKRKEAERLLLESTQTPSEDMSDEARVLKKEIDSLRDEINLGKLVSKFPVLAEKQTEFDEFRAEYPRHKLENVAKLFLVEHGLLENVPDRPGLERPTGGPRTTQTTKYTSEDIDQMMKHNNRKFQQLVKEGKLKPEDIEADVK